MERVLVVLALLGLVLVVALLLRRRGRSTQFPSQVDPGEVGLERAGVGVVEFASRFCEPCQAWEAALREAEVPFAKVDVGEHPGLARRYGVRETPLVLAVRVPAGEVIAAHGGDPDPDAVSRLRALSVDGA